MGGLATDDFFQAEEQAVHEPGWADTVQGRIDDASQLVVAKEMAPCNETEQNSVRTVISDLGFKPTERVPRCPTPTAIINMGYAKDPVENEIRSGIARMRIEPFEPELNHLDVQVSIEVTISEERTQ